MDAYGHLRILLSLILGLAITRVLSGLSRHLQDPRKTERMHGQIVWSLSLLLGAVHFWWWEFALRLIEGWNFGVYLFVLSYASLFFLMATLLYPDHIQDQAEREVFFVRRRRAFFGIFALSFVFDLFDTSLKGQDYMAKLGAAYFARLGIGLVIAFISMRTEDSRRLMWLGVVWLIIDIIWIARHYGVLG
ncbi:hypothetical protein CN97_19015 [Haematobacter massiliensis]|uniref:Uncharacterized protein n=1 Tax=Haematobacter massiliensis TaxID=195105 RepID=A0A086Y267_9RHOB|nr:hypothetical protein [Haematobacter massiliensis]KFI28367.1 hypothetical protein CN97_19015 [Haematobacter massiliensis]OWJ84694.1 hypothetical protein CDV51_13540 [Haematobacter massiliensis]